MDAYPCSVEDIPRYMEEVDFINVSVDFLAVTIAPDSFHHDYNTKVEFIEAKRQTALDTIVLGQNVAPGVWNKSEVDRLNELVNKHFDVLYEGKKIWDIEVSMLMITRGYKQ